MQIFADLPFITVASSYNKLKCYSGIIINVLTWVTLLCQSYYLIGRGGFFYMLNVHIYLRHIIFLILLNFTLNIWFKLKRMEVIIEIELELICVYVRVKGKCLKVEERVVKRMSVYAKETLRFGVVID